MFSERERLGGSAAAGPSSKPKGKTIATRHSDQTVTEALLAMALEGGNSGRAARRMKELGTPVTSRTIRRWAEKHPDRLDELRREHLPRLKTSAAARHDYLAERNLEVHAKALDRLEASVGEMEGRDVTRVVQPTAIASGVHRDKAAALRGDVPPPQITLSLTDTVRGLAARAAKFFDNDGNEVTPEQVIQGQARRLPAAEPAEQFKPEQYMPEKPPPEVAQKLPEPSPSNPRKEEAPDS